MEKVITILVNVLKKKGSTGAVDKVAKYLGEIGGILTWGLVLVVVVSGIVLGVKWYRECRWKKNRDWSWAVAWGRKGQGARREEQPE